MKKEKLDREGKESKEEEDKEYTKPFVDMAGYVLDCTLNYLNTGTKRPNMCDLALVENR